MTERAKLPEGAPIGGIMQLAQAVASCGVGNGTGCLRTGALGNTLTSGLRLS
jgi:hypothetical protein